MIADSIVKRCESLLVIALTLVVALNAHAQVAGGTISGTIADSSGRVVAGAHVTITNLATSVVRDVATNTEGFYSVPNLLPGTYTTKFSAPGFKTEARNGIVLTVGSSVSLDVVLSVGSTIETVTVESEVPAVQLSSSDISAVIGATTVRELPLNGRSWTDLAQLQPGVAAIQTQPSFSAGTDRGNRGFGQQLTISGARPQQNNYRLDGVSLNDYANGAPGSVLGGNLGVDAIQEFSVLTTNYSADYGKTSGGVVNAITRSGTNQLHGSLYEFLRNSRLDAKNYFDDPTQPIPPFKRNQFGGALGGPILKDKTFFFGDYEAIRQSKGISALTTVPSQNARNGLLCSSPPADNSCSPNAVSVDPNAAAFFTFWHLPNGQLRSNGDTGDYTFSGQQIVNENFFTVRLDHHFSESDGLFGTYMFDRTTYSSPDGLNNVEFATLTARQFVSMEETHTFSPTFTNSIRIGGNHELVNNNQSLKAINPDAARTDLGVGGTAFAGRNAPQILMDGVTPFTGGVGGSPTYYYHWHSIQGYDDAFVTHGKHSIRFGGAVEKLLMNELAATDANGIWRFGSLTDFLQNNPAKFQGGIASTVSPRNIHQTLFGAYVQDDWRMKPNLTVNLGLRYEMTTVVHETAGKLSNLPALDSGTPKLGNPFFPNPTLKDFEPRLGFAWDPFHNGQTALRGGFGIFDVQPLPYQFTLLTNQAVPFFSYTVVNSLLPGDFPTFAKSQITTFPNNRLRATYINRPKRNYVYQWNLNIQQQITPSLSGMVAYVGSRGVHQPFRVDEANLVMPTKTPFGYVWPKVDVFGNTYSAICNKTDPGAKEDPSCLPPDPLNIHYGSVRSLFYEGMSYYNALELQLSKRMSHGFQMQGTYTWSKSIDTSSATTAGDAFGNSISSLPWFDLRLNRGLSDFNIGRVLVVNGTWELPGRKWNSAPARLALGGWELGLIFTASDGVPFTPTWGTGADPLSSFSSDDWDVVNRLSGPGCRTAVTGHPGGYINLNCFAVPTAPNQAFFNQYCDPAPPSLGGPLAAGDLRCFNLRGNAGRNSIIGPGIASLDFSIFKNNYIRSISERFNIQFRAEIFNILNHPNFGPPTMPDNTDIFDGTGTPTGVAGLLSRTTTTAREMQFAVKIIF